MPTIHSQRLGVDLHLGKQPASPLSSEHIQMRELLKALPDRAALPPIPKHFGHGYDFGSDGWLMLGNGPDDTVYPGFGGAGDCFWAGQAHSIMEAAKDAGRPVPPFSGKTIVEQYAAYSGYDPQTGANDNGSDPQTGLAWHQTKGIYDNHGTVHRIGATVALTPGDLHELWAAAYLFECAGVGFEVQAAQMDQFDSENPWAYVPGSPIEGGHWVIVPGDNGLITWGHRWGWVPSWYANLNDETFAWIDPLRYRRVTGETLEHFANADLEKFIVLVAQAKAA